MIQLETADKPAIDNKYMYTVSSARKLVNKDKAATAIVTTNAVIGIPRLFTFGKTLVPFLHLQVTIVYELPHIILNSLQIVTL